MKEMNDTGNLTAMTGNTSNSRDEMSNFYPEGTLITACFYTLISATAILGNLLVIIAVKINYNLQCASNFLLVNLAIADFFQGAVSIPLRLYELLNTSNDVAAVCTVAIPVSVLFGGTSNLNIMFISMERFVAINWPYMYYARVNSNVVVAVILFIWVSVGTLSLLPVVGWGGMQPSHTNFCRFPLFLTEQYIVTLYILIHIIPITTTVFLYGFILKASCFQARKIHSQDLSVAEANKRLGAFHPTHEPTTNHLEMANDPQPGGTYKRRWFRRGETTKQLKAVKTVSVVVGLFIVLVVPIIVIDVNEMFGGPKAPALLVKITVCMIYANHCVNVFAYAGFNGEYRRTFKNIILKSWRFISSRITCSGRE